MITRFALAALLAASVLPSWAAAHAQQASTCSRSCREITDQCEMLSDAKACRAHKNVCMSDCDRQVAASVTGGSRRPEGNRRLSIAGRR